MLEAISFNNEARVRHFLRAGASTAGYSYDNFITTPLHVAAVGGSESVIKLLLDQNPDMNARNETGATPLMKAIVMKRPESVMDVLLTPTRYPAKEINLADELRKTALHYAVETQQLRLVRRLLQDHFVQSSSA